MGLTIYLDGEFVDEAEARVSVFDHGLLYGDGVFEGIRAYHGRVFKLDQHLQRLYHSARALNLRVPLAPEALADVVLEACRRNNLRDGYIRLVVTRGRGDLGLDPVNCPEPTVFCIAARIQLYPEEFYQKGLEVVTVPTRRNGPESVNPRIKSLNYLNNILAKLEAHLSEVPEALLLNNEGYVAEATGDNVFIVSEGALVTPPSWVGLLEGVTRNTVMELARARGIPVVERPFTRYEVYVADECFLTGTAAEVVPVVKVDGRVIGQGSPGQLTKQLIASFHELTRTDGPEIF